MNDEALSSEVTDLEDSDLREFEMLLGSNIQPSHVDVGGEHPVQLGEIVCGAQKQSGLSVKQWNALPSDEREAYIQDEIFRRVLKNFHDALQLDPAPREVSPDLLKLITIETRQASPPDLHGEALEKLKAQT